MKIDWTKLPRRFVDDSRERGVFWPEDPQWATEDELKELRADAEFYADKWGPDMCPPGIKASARAVIRRLDKLRIK